MKRNSLLKLKVKIQKNIKLNKVNIKLIEISIINILSVDDTPFF